MKLLIDTDSQTLTIIEGRSSQTVSLYSKASFEAISRQWVRSGWSLSYYMNFSWLGLPIIQIPDDLIRLQEVVYQLRPDVIVETGVFRGGSLVFHASLCQLLSKGRVIGIDLPLHKADREPIERHALAHRITLIEGNSTSPAIASRVPSGENTAARRSVALGLKPLATRTSEGSATGRSLARAGPGFVALSRRAPRQRPSAVTSVAPSGENATVKIS